MQAPDTLSLLTNAAKDAGEIALGYVERGLTHWDKGNGAGPVTEADLAVDSYLRETLCATRPDYGWLSEETADSEDRLGRDAMFIVDPIDGTRAFIEGSKDWSISLAVVRQGEVTDAVVYLPKRGDIYTASIGQGARKNGNRIKTSDPSAGVPLSILTAKANLDPDLWHGPLPEMKRHFRSSIAYRLCLVAEGRFDAMFAFRPSWEWDIAAGDLIVREAGGTASDRSGDRIHYNAPHPQAKGIVAAGGAFEPIIRAMTGKN